MPIGFQPIAERELRAAARRKGTFRIRCWTALLAFLPTFLSLLSGKVLMASTAVFAGSLFTAQTVCAFAFALLAGAFLTSDCLSEEKREGTLRLLFLTDLKAGDIVLGKFAATSVNAICGLLALLPIMGIPLLLGGVTLGEFWRMVLALVNTLFFSLAAGLAVSALVTDYSRAMGLTLGWLTVLGVVLPGLAELSALVWPRAWTGFAWTSPFYPFACAREAAYLAQPAKFWGALLLSHGVAWGGLAVAGVALGRLWRIDASGVDRFDRFSTRTSARAGVRRRTGAGQPFDPVVRLVGSMPLLHGAAWAVAVLWGALVCIDSRLSTPILPNEIAPRIGAFALKALVAFQACRFFVETRRNGALELLLCTPLRTADLVKAQWRLLRRIFLWPITVFLVLCWTAAALSPVSASPMGAAGFGGYPDMEGVFIRTVFLSLGLVADTLAVGWFGLWLALTVKRPGVAPGLTILAVLILPTLLYRFDLVADMLFISWGTTRFQEEFRWIVGHPTSPVAIGVPARANS